MTHFIVIAGNRFLTIKKTDTVSMIPFCGESSDEKKFFNELEQKLGSKLYVMAYDLLMDNRFNTGKNYYIR